MFLKYEAATKYEAAAKYEAPSSMFPILPCWNWLETSFSFTGGWLNEGLPCLPCYNTPLDPNATFPLIGKPRRGWGARGLHILADREAFLKISIDQNQEFVWQPCSAGI